MSNWVGCTNILDPSQKVWVNLDQAVMITSNTTNGSRITLPDGTEVIVADKAEDILSGLKGR